MLLANILDEARLSGNDHEVLSENDWTPQDAYRAAQRMARNMRRHNRMALKDGVNDLEDLGMHDSDIASTLKQIKPEILFWLSKGLAQNTHTDQLIYQIFLLADLGIEWQELTKLLEDHKQDVVKSTLKYLQQNIQDSIVLMHIRGYIERFTRLGIRWPELRIIWTSVTSELKKQDLDESNEEEIPHWFAAIVDYIGDTDIAGAVNMCKTYHVNAKNTPMIANYMESNKWYLLRYLERCLGMSFQGFDEINKDIKGLRFIGVNWPELTTFYDDNKDAVMRLLLQQVSSYDEDAGYYTWQEVNALRQAGVKWPELDIVMKGAMSLMDNKRDDMNEAARTTKGPKTIPLGNGSSIDNPARGPGAMTYSGDPDGYTFKDAKAKASYEKLKSALERSGKKAKYLGASQSKQAGRDSFVLTAPGLVWVYLVGERPGDLKDVIYVKGEPIQTSKFRWTWTGHVDMDRTLSGDKIDALWSRSRTPNTFLSNLHKLKIDDKKFRKVVDKYKEDFLKFIVAHLANNAYFNHRPADETIDYLVRRGVKWPELGVGWISERTIPRIMKILKNSINDMLAGRHAIDDPMSIMRNLIKRYGHDENSKRVLSSAMSAMLGELEVFFITYMIGSPYQLESARRMIQELNNLGIVSIGPFEDFAQEIESRKPQVLRMLLQQVKDKKEIHHLRDVLRAIKNLREQGIDWPEFKAIEKSLKSQGVELTVNEDRDYDWDDRRRELRQDDDSGYVNDYDDELDWDKVVLEYKDAISKMGPDVSELGDIIDELERLGIDYSEIRDMIHDEAAFIADWFKKNVGSNDSDSVIDFLDKMYTYRLLEDEKVVSALHGALDQHKDAVMRWLLTMVKKIMGTKDRLEILGIMAELTDWPELSVINRSLNAGYKELRESNLYSNRVNGIIQRDLDAIRNHGPYYIATMMHNLLREKNVNSRMVADIFNDNKSVLLHSIDVALSSGDPSDALSGITVINKVLDGSKWPEISDAMVKNLPQIKEYISRIIGHSGWGNGYNNAFYIYEQLVNSKIDPAVIKEFRDFIRDRVLAVIRNAIKDRGFDRTVFDGLEVLSKMNVKVDLGSGPMSKRLLSDFNDQLAKDGLHRAENYIKTIIRFGGQQLNQEMRNTIEANKIPVIRNMLQFIKQNAAYAVYPQVTTLEHLGFRWPELNTIKKAAKDLL